MVSLQTEARLARVFLFVGQQEHQIEQTRQSLARLPNFEPYACFQRIDRLEHGYLTSTDLYHFFRDHNIDALEGECAAIVAYFDSNNDAALSFFDFLHILLPCENPALRASASQRPTYEVNRFDFLPREVEVVVARLLEHELILLQRTEALKRDLLARYDYNMIDAFNLVTGRGSSQILFEDFQLFLKKNGHLPRQNEVIGLVRRVDRDADFKILYKEFMDFLMPAQKAPEPMRDHRIREQAEMKNDLRRSRSGSASPFRRSYNRLNQLEREISSEVPVRVDPREYYRDSSPRRSGSALGGSPVRSSYGSFRPNHTYGQDLGADLRYARDDPMTRSFRDMQNEGRNGGLLAPPSRLGEGDRYSRERSPARRSVRFADQQVKERQPQNGFMDHLAPPRWKHQRSESQNYEPKSRTPVRQKTPSKSPMRRTLRNSADMSTSPDRKSLNLSGRRCEACNPEFRENYFGFTGTTATSAAKKKKKSVKKNSKSPYTGKKSTTPGRRSTKYSESAMSRGRMHDETTHSPRTKDIARFSPMRPDDEGELIEVFKHQIAIERDAERQRQELALCSDFNLMDLFKYFDVNCTGSVSEYDLELGLRDFRVTATKKEIDLFFKHFDVDCDKRLKFTEFSAALTPKQSEYSAVLHNRNPQFSGAQRAPLHLDVFLSRDTRAKLAESFKVFFNLEIQGQDLRNRIYNNQDFSIKEAFVACDRDGNGLITLDEFRALLGDYKVYVSEKELAMLLDRYDRNKQMGVSFSAFVEELTPKLRPL